MRGDAGRRATRLGWLAIAAAILIRLPTLGQPLVEAHTFRQTQTAYTAVMYHRDGIDLLRTPLPTLGPPWDVPFEFPLFQAGAAIAMDAGLDTEVALRGLSLVCFVLAVPVLWDLVRREAGSRVALLAAIVFAWAPVTLLWSRSSTIETLALLLALATVHRWLAWDRSGGRSTLLVACVLAAIAALVKLPTAGIWLLPGVFLVRRSLPGRLGPPAIALVAGLAWTIASDAIKAATPATAQLTTSALRDWNFGTVAQRLDPAVWLAVLVGVASAGGLLILLRPAAIGSTRIARWALITAATGPLVFFNLYTFHDYYWMANAPAIAILVAQVVDAVLSDPIRFRRIIAGSAGAVLVIVSIVAYPRVWRMFDGAAADEADTLRLAQEVASRTTPSDLVAIRGRDWSPGVLFYADRRGYTEWKGAPPAPAGYIRFDCPPEGAAGDCVLVGVTDGVN